MHIWLEIMEINSKPCAQAALNIPQLPAHFIAFLPKSISIALNCGDALDLYSLYRVYQVLQGHPVQGDQGASAISL